MLKKSVQLTMLADSRSCFDALARATVRHERLLMIDLKTVKDS